MTAKDWHLMKQRHHEGFPPGMKRFSILYELPYWTSLRINHLLDPMHIFKNVGSLLWDHITGRKDSHGARADLQDVGIMEELWPVTTADGRITLPKAPWVLAKAEEHKAKHIIRTIRTPTGLMHSLRTAFTSDGKLSGLKSHDWHKMCQVCPCKDSQSMLTYYALNLAPPIMIPIYFAVHFTYLRGWVINSGNSNHYLQIGRISAVDITKRDPNNLYRFSTKECC